MGAPAEETRGTWLFCVLACGITNACMLPAALARLGVLAGPVESYMPLALPAVFGPTFAAVVVTWRESGGDGVRALFRRFRITGFGARWYVIALLYTTVAYAAGVAVYRLFGGAAVPWAFFPANAEQVLGMVIVPFAEEVGWRGFALPRLQRTYSPLRASLVLGAVWALWHTTLFLSVGDTGAMLALAYLNIVTGSLIFSWFFNGTRGSLLIAYLAHVGAHLNSASHALPPTVTTFAIFTVSLAVMGVGLVAIDHRKWTTPPA